MNKESKMTKQEIFDHIKEIFNKVKDYDDSDLQKVNSLMDMKELLSDINNLLTLHTTYAFLNWLKMNKKLLNIKADFDSIIDSFNPDANANGYDIAITESNPKIYAEIKCTKPIYEEGGELGSKQEESWENDIDKLLHPENHNKRIKDELKKTELINNVDNAIKFFVVARTSKNLESAIRKFVASQNNSSETVKIYSESEQLDTNIIYVVIVDF